MSRLLPRLAILAVLFFAATSHPAHAAAPALQLRDDDVWVMAGDSITAQRLHTNYIEAFYRTRYPKLRLHFRNSGIGGNRANGVLARFDYDVAAWKPTIVSVELGMNDVGGSEEAYITGMKELIGRIRAIRAQPVLISSSPVDAGSAMGDWRSPRCEKLHLFTEALRKLAEEEKVVFIDQLHPLMDLWTANRRKPGIPKPPATSPALPVSVAGATPAPPPPKPPVQPPLIPLGGDPVHPGEVGQYTMAAVILAGLKAEGEVSSATLQADGKVIEAKRCQITEATAKDGKLSFTRLDEAGPWPIQPSAKTALTLHPEILDLSRYTLRVTGLADGPYRISINGQAAGTVSAKELAAGWNMTAALDGFFGERATALLALIGTLQSGLNTTWRAASQTKDREKLAAAQKAIVECEAEIQAAVQPMPLRFDIEK